MPRPDMLQERQKTHGDFRSNAAISQALKQIINRNTTKVSEDLCPVHREALDMICLKLSRILSGHASFKDHWDDVAGYAQLGAEACYTDEQVKHG